MSLEWQEDYLKLVNSSENIGVYNLDPTRSLTIDVVSAVNSDYEVFSVADDSRTYGTLGDCPLTLPPLDEFYIYGGDGIEASVTLSLVYASNLTTLVPAAISSELDDSGQERIHIANKITLSAPPIVCTEGKGSPAWGGGGSNSSLYVSGTLNAPTWLNGVDNPIIYVDFFDDGNMAAYQAASQYHYDRMSPENSIGTEAGRGTIYSQDMSQSVCFEWEIPGGS